METLDLLEGAFASTGARIAAVTAADLDRPTPCSEWDVRALLNHATGVVTRFAATAGRTAQEHTAEEDFIGDDPSAAFQQAAKAALHAWSQPGALQGKVTLPMGIELPAPAAASVNLIDTLVHGWDVATALGHDATLDPELATAAYEAALSIVKGGFRPGAAFAPPVTVPGDASPSDKLVALLGRQP